MKHSNSAQTGLSRRIIYDYLNQKIPFSKSLMLLYGLFTMLITAISLVSPYLYKTLVDEVMTAGNVGLLYHIIPAMLVVYLIKVMLSGIHTYVSKRFTYRTTLEVKQTLMNKFLQRELPAATGRDIGVQSNNLEQDSQAVPTFVLTHVVDFITSFLTTLVYLTLMVRINLYLGLLSLVLLPLTIWISQTIGQKYNAVDQETHVVKSKTKTHLFDTMQKWRDIKTNTLEDSFSSRYDEMLEPERALNSRWMFYFALNGFFYGIKEEYVIKVLIYFAGGLFIIQQDITIGALLMFVSYMESMSTSLDSLIKSNTDFLGQHAAFERLFRILDEPETSHKQAFPPNSVIELQDLDFTYNTSDISVLENASCKFECGKKYLLIGKSGEGKSTLIKLLLGLIPPQKGKILFSGISAEEINSQNLLKNIGVVMQDNTFFNMSIRDNLALIAPEVSEEDMIAALKSASLYDFVESLPEQMDTIIGERGIKLSGGQKQRLAIARLLLHDPQIVLLDEATSALDSVTEHNIMERLKEHFRGRTMIVISHKPLVDFQADKIFVVEKKGIKAYS